MARAGQGSTGPTALIELAGSLGIADSVRFLPPLTGDDLADLYRAADLVAVPSTTSRSGWSRWRRRRAARRCVAAAVGGLVTAVRDGV